MVLWFIERLVFVVCEDLNSHIKAVMIHLFAFTQNIYNFANTQRNQMWLCTLYPLVPINKQRKRMKILIVAIAELDHLERLKVLSSSPNKMIDRMFSKTCSLLIHLSLLINLALLENNKSSSLSSMTPSFFSSEILFGCGVTGNPLASFIGELYNIAGSLNLNLFISS